MNDNDQSAGATPAAPGATPGQTPPATPSATPTPPPSATPPATDDDAALGEGGKRALDAERASRRAAEDRAKAAEKERDDLKAATLSESEKAIADAKKAGQTEATERYAAVIRRSEVKAALAAAGIQSSVMDLAVKADEFAALKVGDDGNVEGLDEAVKAFKGTRKDLFTKPGTDGSADGGARNNGAQPATTLEGAIGAHYDK